MSIQTVYDAVLEFNNSSIVAEIKRAMAEGADAGAVLADGLIKAMDEVGQRYARGEFFVPEMLSAARTMKTGLDYLKPHLAEAQSEKEGTIVIGTVKGDLHDIGKNLVAIMLEGGGFEVVDIGVDAETAKFVTAIQEQNADIVCLSALLTTTMGAMQKSVQEIKTQCPRVWVMVGGAPVTQEFADKIGANGYSGDAAGAVVKARELLAG
ncbi:MAG: corrinoid protein [Gracilibacteraceae bacterium]|jgi:5-methyltetrahydrofolate--homocysteine methyltransferase|nr:corrinoid protein [Gracilibacteraceae bacterium]